MAVYTYRCDGKGKENHVFELDQKLGAEPVKTCVKCGKPCHRIIAQPTTIQYKGNDWTRKSDREF